MQDVTPWPESFDVSEPVARVLVDGKEVDVEAVTVTSELDSAMPERVAAGGGGVVAATGNTSILRAEDVSDAGFNPWGDAQQFVNASEVVVEAGYRDPATGGVGCARQVTGQVESLDGGATTASAGLEFVDYTPLLDRDITIEPLLQQYPSLEDWGPMRGAGLSPIYITDRVLRHCGFYATPPMIGGAVVSAPMMGSAWPERGVLLSAHAESSISSPAAFRPVPWGLGLGNGVVRYVPHLGNRSHARFISDIHVSFQLLHSISSNPEHLVIDLCWGSHEDAIRITVRDDGEVLVFFRGGGSEYTLVTSMHTTLPDNAGSYSIRMQPTGQVTIYASNGASASGSATVPARLVSHNMDEVYAQIPQSSHTIGGLQVAFSASHNHTFQRNAHIDPPAHYHSLKAFPFRHNANCMALLKEQAEAELAAMWIDEFGHFRWRNRYQLRDAPPQGTLTSTHELLDLPWQVPVSSVFSRVELEHDVATVTRRGVPSITVSDTRGSTLTNGDIEDRFFEPPANQDWHEISPPVWIGSSDLINDRDLKRGRGSYYGGIIINDNDEERIAYSSWLSPRWIQINPQRLLLSYTVQELAPDEYIEQRFRDSPARYGKYAGENLPLIRCKGLVEWESIITTGQARGPLLAPVLVHKVGPWIQSAAELQSLADWLSENLTKSDVILRDIPIVPDPRIQLGDVFWLEDQTAYNVRLRVVVMGKTIQAQATGSGYEMSQKITCRVLDVARQKVEYGELESAWAEHDYEDFQSAWSGQDYDALNENPLDRS